MSKIEIPTMLFWDNGNTWYGSMGNARFFIKPVAYDPEEGSPEGTPKRQVFEVELWRGPLTKQFSEVTIADSFPHSEEGREQMIVWLEEQADLMNQT